MAIGPFGSYESQSAVEIVEMWVLARPTGGATVTVTEIRATTRVACLRSGLRCRQAPTLGDVVGACNEPGLGTIRCDGIPIPHTEFFLYPGFPFGPCVRLMALTNA